MADKDLPLPTFEEVMICSENTSLEEVSFNYNYAVIWCKPSLLESVSESVC